MSQICFPFYTVIDIKDIYLFVGINLLNVFMLLKTLHIVLFN